MKQKVLPTDIGYRRAIVFGIALALLVSMGIMSAQAAPSNQSSNSPETDFQSKCASCHTIGRGNLVGPDLKGVTTRQSRDWLVRWIVAPDKLIAQGDPIAKELVKKYQVPMPNLGISQAEAEGMLDYIEAQSGGAAGKVSGASTGAAAPSGSGDPTIGKEYFNGARVLQNGGPACIACHSVSGIGALGGGALGPDLTQAYAKFGDQGLASILDTMPFPTMSPIFGTRTLTPQEQASLKAYLQQAAVAERPIESLGLLAVLAVVGTGVLLLLAQLFWRNRLTAVRQPLVERR